VALNQQYGFGKIRSTRLITKVAELIEQSKEDEVFGITLTRKLLMILAYCLTEKIMRSGINNA
jgi:hypothetical protein